MTDYRVRYRNVAEQYTRLRQIGREVIGDARRHDDDTALVATAILRDLIRELDGEPQPHGHKFVSMGSS